jgi:hypothetical protein
MALTYLTDELFRSAIAVQEREFDAHDVIQYFYREHQVAYVRELALRLDVGSYPVTETNRLIGRELQQYSDLLERQGDCNSPTFGSQATPCAKWRKT